MNLTLWRIEHQTDSNCYDIRERSRKAALDRLDEHPEPYVDEAGNFTVEKVVLTYSDGFDLADALLSEGREYGLTTETRTYRYNLYEWRRNQHR